MINKHQLYKDCVPYFCGKKLFSVTVCASFNVFYLISVLISEWHNQRHFWQRIILLKCKYLFKKLFYMQLYFTKHVVAESTTNETK